MSATEGFFDSNIILYLAGSDPVKAARSDELLRRGGVISVQVCNEVVRVTRSKYKFEWAQVDLLLAGVRRTCRIESLTPKTLDLSLKICRERKLQVFDSSIVAAALLAGCDTLWSEDMQDGQLIDGHLTIRNPYR